MSQLQAENLMKLNSGTGMDTRIGPLPGCLPSLPYQNTDITEHSVIRIGKTSIVILYVPDCLSHDLGRLELY